jgi:hypothetical protein
VRDRAIRTNATTVRTKLLVTPAANIRVLSPLDAFSTSSSSGSTNAPKGMTASITAPMLSTRMSPTLQSIPCPNSWTTMPMSRPASISGATDRGRKSFMPGITRTFWGSVICVGSGVLKMLRWAIRRSMTKEATMTTAATATPTFV